MRKWLGSVTLLYCRKYYFCNAIFFSVYFNLENLMSKTEIAHLLESIISPKLNGVWFQNQNIRPKSLVFKVVTNIFCNKVIFTWLNLTIYMEN